MLAASVLSGGLELYKDLRVAFRDAGPSVFGPTVRIQLDALRERLPPGASLLLVSAGMTDSAWYTRLFQRGLYPRTIAIVRNLPTPDPADLERIRSRYGVRFAISMGNPPPDPGFLTHEDLGPLPGIADRVWFGELAP